MAAAAAAAPQDAASPPAWWKAFPEARSSPPRVAADDVRALLEKADAAPGAAREFLLVDVRRDDWVGGTVATSINLPAHTFYQTRPMVYQLCKQAGITSIIFYCGSSNGRGPRAAGWMQDYLDEVGESDIKALILAGGIKGWVKAYGGKLMDWYDEKAWA